MSPIEDKRYKLAELGERHRVNFDAGCELISRCYMLPRNSEKALELANRIQAAMDTMRLTEDRMRVLANEIEFLERTEDLNRGRLDLATERKRREDQEARLVKEHLAYCASIEAKRELAEEKIREIHRNTDPQHALSDQQICEVEKAYDALNDHPRSGTAAAIDKAREALARVLGSCNPDAAASPAAKTRNTWAQRLRGLVLDRHGTKLVSSPTYSTLYDAVLEWALNGGGE